MRLYCPFSPPLEGEAGPNAPQNPEPGFNAPGEAGGDPALGVEPANEDNTEKATLPGPAHLGRVQHPGAPKNRSEEPDLVNNRVTNLSSDKYPSERVHVPTLTSGTSPALEGGTAPTGQ